MTAPGLVTRTFQDRSSARRLRIPVGAQVVHAALGPEDGWITLTFANYNEDVNAPATIRAYKAVHDYAYPVRDKWELVAQLGDRNLIEITPREREISPRKLRKLDIQVAPMKLGVNVLKLPSGAIVNTKCPLRVIQAAPNLCFRGDTRKTVQLAAYVLVCASPRSKFHDQHVRTGLEMASRGIVVALDTHNEYDLWADLKLTGGNAG